MSKLSPYVRAAIDSGTALPAIVEEINLGLATVRLGNRNGARLTNLSIMGEGVAVGAQVIVDYAAGIDPIVRPMTTISENLDEMIDFELAPAVEIIPVELLTPAEGVGCAVGLDHFDRQWESGTPKLPMYPNVPLSYPFNGSWWDGGGMYYPWHQGIQIKEAGYYLMNFTVIEPLNCTEIWAIFPPGWGFQLPVKEHMGVFRVRLLCSLAAQ